jgi:hypothetical protein
MRRELLTGLRVVLDLMTLCRPSSLTAKGRIDLKRSYCVATYRPWLSEIGARRFPGNIRHLVKHWTEDLGAFRPIGRNRLKDHFVEVILVAVKAITEVVRPLKILTA